MEVAQVEEDPFAHQGGVRGPQWKIWEKPKVLIPLLLLLLCIDIAGLVVPLVKPVDDSDADTFLLAAALADFGTALVFGIFWATMHTCYDDGRTGGEGCELAMSILMRLWVIGKFVLCCVGLAILRDDLGSIPLGYAILTVLSFGVQLVGFILFCVITCKNMRPF